MDDSNCLNPIFDYASEGQYCEKHGEWENAVRWYHRAMACFPNHIGSDKKIRPFEWLQSRPVLFTRQHASRMYAALGRCLMKLDRGMDSLLAFRAASSLDPDSLPAQRFRRAEELILKGEKAEARVRDGDPAKIPGVPKRDLKRNLTVILATHCTKRLKKFEMLSPPSCKLVTATYGSMLKVFGDEVSRCPKILCYDINPKGSANNVHYGRTLEGFARQQGFEFQTYPGIGLFNVLNTIIAAVTTPYLMFVEHDWLFQGPDIRLGAIIDMMDRDPKMHSVRFNKRDNYIDGHDYIVQVAAPQRGMPVLRTSAFSNNPSVIRTNKLKNDWLPLCEKSLHRVSGGLGGSAFGIEEILFKHQVDSVRHQGFDETHPQWGTFIYGGAGDPRRIVHIGE